ncbi:MAG: hypothetical protein U0176_06930 [Bacteroidia bacterium]
MKLEPLKIAVALLCIWLVLPGSLRAGGESQALGARRVGLGFAYTGVRGDFWQIGMNPAGIAGIKQMEAGAYIERRFLLNQLNMGSLGFAMPFYKGKHFAGFDASAFGFGGYAESKVGLSYATTLFERISLGAKLNYALISIDGYGNKSTFFANAGINCILSKHLNVGFRIFNANRAELQKDQDEKIPTTLDAGLAYQVSDKVLIVADIEKQVNYPLSLRGGVEYCPATFIKARIGASSQPVTLNAGVGIVVKGLNVDFSSTLHQYLGYTPALSLSYKFGAKTEEE